MKNTTLLGIFVIGLIIVGGFIFVNSKNNIDGNATANNDNSNGNAQKIVIGIKNGNYYPNIINVKAGQSVSISLDNSVTGCFRSFTIKQLGLSKNLRTPEDTLTFTPTEKGTYNFACIMGMGYGKLIVE